MVHLQFTKLLWCPLQVGKISLPSGAECCQQVFPRVRVIVDRLAIAPVEYRRHRNAELLGQRPDALFGGLNVRSRFGCRCRVRVKPDIQRRASSSKVFSNSRAHHKQ